MLIPIQILLTGEEGVGKLTILNLFPGENILEIDLDLNEIFRKQIDILDLKNSEECILRVIDLNELIKNLRSYKDLLQSIDIICVVSNSILSNIEDTRRSLLKLKQKLKGIDYYIIANFQDRKKTALEVEKIEELLEEKTFGFSAVQKDAKKRILSIIKDIVRISNLKKEEEKHLFRNYDDIWSEIEKARILETQGDRIKAIESFSNAASQFKRLFMRMESKREREEINIIYYLCKAWECMANAEEFKEPKKFLEAMNYFIRVSELIHYGKLKLLALGNSEFCKVLNLGMKFEQSNQTCINKEDYLKIKEIFNKIADLYRQGGFEKDKNWALATSSHFDAFVNDSKEA